MEAVLKTILLISSAGFLGLAIKKLPHLAALKKSSNDITLIQNGVEKIKDTLHPRKIEIKATKELEKALRKCKILFIKTENKIEHWLTGLRNANHRAIKAVEEEIQIKQEKEVKETRKRHHYFGQLIKSLKDESEKFKLLAVKSIKPKHKVITKFEPEQDLPFRSSLKVKDEKKINEEHLVAPKYIKEIERRLIDMILENPKNITAYKKLGLLYIEQGEKEKARECLEMVLKLGSKDKRVREKLEELNMPA